MEQPLDHIQHDDGDNPSSPARHRESDRAATVEPIIVNQLPRQTPVLKDELSIWRAFLAEEINAILRDEE